jgi:hypothetical protein
MQGDFRMQDHLLRLTPGRLRVLLDNKGQQNVSEKRKEDVNESTR